MTGSNVEIKIRFLSEISLLDAIKFRIAGRNFRNKITREIVKRIRKDSIGELSAMKIPGTPETK